MSSRQALHICCCPGITNAGLTHISEMHGLLALDLTGLSISDFGLAMLAELPQLQKLRLAQCPRLSKAGELWMKQNSQSPAMQCCAASLAAQP